MKASDGNVAIAAAALGRNESVLRDFIRRDQQLSAVWPFDTPPKPPDEMDLMTRGLPPEDTCQLTPTLSVIGEAAMAEDREILRQGLKASGINEDTIKKLALMEGMATNTGRFLGAALDLTHRLTVFQGVALFERAEKIKKDYLDDETLPHEIKIEWQKAYNEIAELIAKTSDRVLAGTQAAVAMMRSGEKEAKGGGGKGKPGFQPLRRVQEIKPHGHPET